MSLMNETSPQTSREWLDLKIAGIEPAGRGTKRFKLTREDGVPLPAAHAGAHITLRLPGGTERQYSLLNHSPTPDFYEIAIRKESTGRGGSIIAHDRLKVGDEITVLSPRNDFPLDESAAFSVLIGGGIGITPLLAMASRLVELGHPFAFYAAFRSRSELLLTEHINAVPTAVLHFDDEAGGVFPMAAAIEAAPREAHLYCCGPAAMIQAFLEHAKADGREPEKLHVEYFSPPDAPKSDGSFTLELARSGLVLNVPAGKSILEVVREAGIAAPSSCEQGTCGACEVKVLEGVPDHFDAVLTPSERREGKRMMICCSGALGDRLVIDL